MKPEQAELFFIEDLFKQSKERGVCAGEKLELVDRLTGDASTRRYYRIFTDKGAYVVCLDNPQLDPSIPHPFASKQDFFRRAGVRVPAILDMNLARGYLLEEDLGDITFLTHLAGIQDDRVELGLYSRVVEQLLSFHRLPHAEVEGSGLFNLAFDHKKYMEEMDFTFKFFFGHFLKFQDNNVLADIRSEIDSLCIRLAAQPMVPTHRDFHSRNIMVKGEELVFIDFQDARWGIPQYDLVSLLEDCYYDLAPVNRETLKRKYFEELPASAHGQGGWETFCDLYDDMLFQRVFKAIGSFSYIHATRQDARYLKYIGFGMEKIRRTLLSNPRYDRLRQALFRVYYVS